MFQGQGKVWRDGTKVCGYLRTNAPNGPIEWTEEISGEIDDSESMERMRKKAEYVANFFPIKQMVGPRSIKVASEIYSQFVNPATRTEADARIDLTKKRMEAGDDFAFDVWYVLRRIGAMQGEKIAGFSLKKLGKKIKKGAGKVAKVAVMTAIPPYGAYKLAKALRGKKPAAVKKVAAIRQIALSPVETLTSQQLIKAPDGAPLPLPQVAQVQAQAQEALANVQQAAQVQQDTYQQTGDFYTSEEEYYPPEEYPEEEYSDQYYEEDSDFSMQGLYGSGALVSGGEHDEESEASMAGGEEDEEYEVVMAGLWDFVKKVGKTVDPTRTKSLTGPLIKSIPGVGPSVKAGLDLLASAKQGRAASVEKIKQVKELADAGVPKAQEALKTLKQANEMQKDLEKGIAAYTNPLHRKIWIPVIGPVYESGARMAS